MEYLRKIITELDARYLEAYEKGRELNVAKDKRIAVIERILLERWDPLGIKDHTEEQDKYHFLAACFESLLENGRPASTIAEQLHNSELTYLGRETSVKIREAVANKLVQEYLELV